MDLIRFSIQNPVKVAVGVILILLFGLLALRAVPVQLVPDVDRPVVSVSTAWPGRSPGEIERTILVEQEEKLKTLPGLYKMYSSAELGGGFVTLEFQVGFDMSRALQETAARLDEVPSYPEDVERPVIRAADSAGEDAIAYCLIQAEDPTFEMARFYDYADRFVKPAIERIPGVAEVNIYGGRPHQVQVRFDPQALAQRGITVEEFRAALRSDNINESAGDIAAGRQEVRVRVIGQFDSLEPLAQTIIRYDDQGVPIRVADVAEVSLELAKRVYFNQSKGKTSMSLFVKREVGSNVVEIMRQVRRLIDEMNGPNGVMRAFHNDRYRIRIRLVFDDTYYISRSLGLVQGNLWLGGGLAALVLLLFLRSPRATLIIVLAIPISVIGTFVVMALTGRNINVISLAGLSFAVGMVVDNAIVVLENIDRHLAMGERPAAAAYQAAREVWGAILSSTLTTVAVFAPVLTIREESGQLFYDIALAISAAVVLSLVVAISVIPAAGARFLVHHGGTAGLLRRAAWSLFGLAPLSAWLCRGFAHGIYLATIRTPAGFWLRSMIAVLMTCTAIGLSYLLILPASYLPDGNKNFTFGQVFTPPGYSIEQNTLVGERIEAAVRPYWEAKDDAEATAAAPLKDPQTGKPFTKVAPLKEFFFVVSRGRVFMIATSADPENVRPVRAILGQAIDRIPGVRGYASQRSIFGRNAGNANSVKIEVVGDDLETLKSGASYLQTKLWREFTPFAVRSDPLSFAEAGPELQVIVDQVRAKELGLNVNALAAAARAMIDGILAADFNYQGDNIDLILIRDPRIPLSPDELADLPLAVREHDGHRMVLPLGEVVRFVRADASQS
ncbi:MAG: efflux RND transporter permease subunit, partial [Thermogutta sp.]